ncbi:hypothetical protein MVES_000676 [Malassezia vespertilionis]|uniref:non-specific serine/threonine protein kinase n=1 Tax=Malassezia vespertilionis TaxID=2020962 RepID=A0A2N1JGH3_9BASI|nr:hypothetical protein MVES_000676 [Malassezia vespertilionis]
MASKKLPADALSEVRSTEREAIASILGDDFCILPSKAWHGAAQVETYEVILRPEDDAEKKRVAVVAHFALTRAYPNIQPAIYIRSNDPRTRGVDAQQLKQLGETLGAKARTLQGSEMIWELVSIAQEFISANNAAPTHDSEMAKLSLEERMRHREHVEQADEERRVEQEQEARFAAEQQRSDELAGMIAFETQRQMEVMKQERRRLRKTAQLGPSPAPMTDSDVGRMRTADAQAFETHRIALSDIMLGNNAPIAHVDRGPLLEKLPLARIYLATPESSTMEQESMWSVEITPITAAYYAGNAGAKKLAELEEELMMLKKVQDPSLIPLLDFTRTSSAFVRTHLLSLLDALAALHKHHLVHRNVSLPNIYLDKDRAKLTGAVYRRKLLDLHRSNALNAMEYTEHTLPDGWRCPEAISNPLVYNAARDIWDTGRCACELLFGQDVVARYSSPEALFATIRSSETQQARSFLLRMLDRDPLKRGNASELRLLLDDISAFTWDGAWTFQGTPTTDPTTPIRSLTNARVEPRISQRANAPPEQIGSFWQLRNPAALTHQPVSRYISDFEEVEYLGKGAFGVVVKSRNKLDGRFYAVKKIRLSSSAAEEERTMREIMTLSRLDHPHIVRYVTCWIEETHVDSIAAPGTETNSELAMTTSQQMDTSAIRALDRIMPHQMGATGFDDFLSASQDDSLSNLEDFVQFGSFYDEESAGKALPMPDSDSVSSLSSPSSLEPAAAQSQAYSTTRVLYIQMEYVENQTLSDAIERGLSLEEAWHIFRQMLEALSHIASLGIIHRDLKPSNVLMYSNADIKVGDFGLATTHVHAMDAGMRDSAMFDSMGDKELTSGLGTFSYIAPEVLSEKGPATRYNFKVDMFSLGIIFFEMIASQRCYTTTMERHHLLRDLRSPSVKFPRSWDAAQYPAQTEIIRQLLDHDPSKRPSPMAMLRSPLLPPKMQDEYVEELLRLAANPASTQRHQLIDALFSKSQVDELRDYTFDTGSQSEEDDVLVDVVTQYLRGVFQKRGAVPMRPPLLFPPNDIYAQEANVVKLLDKTGNAVFLPFDLTVPFARICARSGHLRIKRFDIADVYRESLLAGGQPRAVLAASFDIVSPDADPVAEAELLGVLDDLLEIPGLEGELWEIQLGHESLLQLLLCRFPKRFRAGILSVLPGLLSKGTEAQVRQQLQQLGLSTAQQEELDAFNLRGDPDTVSQQLMGMLTAQERKEAAAPIAWLRSISRLARFFGVRRTLTIVPCLSSHYDRYKQGTVFAVVRYVNKHREVLAVGGRYDALLKQFAYPDALGTSGPTPHAAGVQIAVGKIVAALAKHQQMAVPRFMSRPEEERTLGPWTPRRCECYLAASGPGLLDARIQLCTQLWANGVSADIQYEHSAGESLEITSSMCRAEGILFLVLLRSHSRVLKVREVIPRTEHEVSKEELFSFLQDRIARQRRIDHHIAHTAYGRSGVAELHTKAPTAASKGAVPSAAPMQFRGIPAADVHVSLPPRSERSRRDKPNDRRLKPAAWHALAEKAASEAGRFAETMLSGSVPLFAVDLAGSTFAHFAALATAPDDTFRAFLGEINATADEREYMRTLRDEICAVKSEEFSSANNVHGTNGGTNATREASMGGSVSQARVLLYSIRDGRLLLSG